MGWIYGWHLRLLFPARKGWILQQASNNERGDIPTQHHQLHGVIYIYPSPSTKPDRQIDEMLHISRGKIQPIEESKPL